MNVLIVGAGPTGLSTAVELARLGIQPTLIEQRSGHSSQSRAVGILPKTLAALAPSGVSDLLRLEGIVIEQAHLHLPDQPNITLNLNGNHQQQLLCLPQNQTERILAHVFDQLGGQIRFESTLQDLHHTQHGCRAWINGQAEDYDIIIAADGIHSTTRTLCQIPYPGFKLDAPWSICDVELNHATPAHLHLFLNEHTTLMLPLSNTRLRLVSTHHDALAALPIQLDINHIHHQSTFYVHVHLAQSYQQHAVYLAGDAAHCHSPVGGRGMNLGIQDGVFLAQCIAQNKLSCYSTIRRNIGHRTLKRTERARKWLNHRTRLSKLILPWAQIPWINHLLVQHVLLAD